MFYGRIPTNKPKLIVIWFYGTQWKACNIDNWLFFPENYYDYSIKHRKFSFVIKIHPSYNSLYLPYPTYSVLAFSMRVITQTEQFITTTLLVLSLGHFLPLRLRWFFVALTGIYKTLDGDQIPCLMNRTV